MKTYEEMAQSVIHRAKAHKVARNRWIAGSVAAVLALGICLGVMAVNGPAGDPTLQTTEPQQTEAPPETTAAVPDSAKVTFLYSDGSKVTNMEPDIEIPCRMEIRVKDIRGLSKEEVDAICEAEKQYARNLVDAHPEAKGYLWGQAARINTVITCISAGHFIIGMEDPKQIESIYATVQGAVHLGHMLFANDDYMTNPGNPLPKEYVLEHSQIQIQYYDPYGGLEIAWAISNDAEIALDEGRVTIGELHDTITFTVTYVDGTAEEHAIDMIFNDNGQVYALYRGATAVA